MAMTRFGSGFRMLRKREPQYPKCQEGSERLILREIAVVMSTVRCELGDRKRSLRILQRVQRLLQNQCEEMDLQHRHLAFR